MSKKALFVWGGWEGHTPKECVEVFTPWLRAQGFDVEVANALAAFDDAGSLRTLSLIVPVWTIGELTERRERNLCDAVAGGVGLAGWHGGLGDAFRNNTDFQFMAGGQFVAHPGDLLPAWDVRILDREHAITRGVEDFTLRDTERYYMHVDPGNHVLAVTRLDEGFDMPVVWTRRWGKGRVAYASFGHTYQDFAVPEARQIVQRCLLWAAGQL